MAKITLVYSYYENPKMFALQQKYWSDYRAEDKGKLEIIVTDDCSSKHPVHLTDISDTGISTSVYRIDTKVNWNWLQARNIGAKYAKGNWLVLTDMDHVISAKHINRLLRKIKHLDPNMVYQFGRKMAPDYLPYKFHNDSFFLTKKLFWKAGGYDECYAGLYGTSGLFRRRLFDNAAGHEQFKDVDLILFPRTIIPDASTTDLKRKEGRDPNAIPKITQWKEKNSIPIRHFIQPYHLVLSRSIVDD